jgi:hypothetical protein
LGPPLESRIEPSTPPEWHENVRDKFLEPGTLNTT